MTARTHDAFAFAALITVAVYYPPESLNLLTISASFVATIVGALLPDIDQAGNRLWDLIPMGENLGRVLGKLFLKHRTISHSLLGIYLVYLLTGWLLPKVLNAGYLNVPVVITSLMVGYLSHIILDSLTKDGLPLFFPLSYKIGFPPLETLRIKTGGGVEKYLVFPGVLAYLLWFVANNQDRLKEIFKLIT